MSSTVGPAAAAATTPLTPASMPVALTPDDLRRHWQGHRKLTRRVIEAFPEEHFATFSIGGMRPFAALAMEVLGMAAPTVRGAARGVWEGDWNRAPLAKADLLREWDEATATIDELWPEIPPERFRETMTAFEQYTGPLYELLLYCIDNEVHHRGQGYVYLRALGVEPPAFWER
jgi:uncharacterized damage-inducible protein DinB